MHKQEYFEVTTLSLKKSQKRTFFAVREPILEPLSSCIGRFFIRVSQNQNFPKEISAMFTILLLRNQNIQSSTFATQVTLIFAPSGCQIGGGISSRQPTGYWRRRLFQNKRKIFEKNFKILLEFSKHGCHKNRNKSLKNSKSKYRQLWCLKSDKLQ